MENIATFHISKGNFALIDGVDHLGFILEEIQLLSEKRNDITKGNDCYTNPSLSSSIKPKLLS
jgi:hypothetical protein